MPHVAFIRGKRRMHVKYLRASMPTQQLIPPCMVFVLLHVCLLAYCVLHAANFTDRGRQYFNSRGVINDGVRHA